MPALSQYKARKRREALKLLISHGLKELTDRLFEEIMTFTSEEHLETTLELLPQTFLALAVETTREIKDERERRRPIMASGLVYPEEVG